MMSLTSLWECPSLQFIKMLRDNWIISFMLVKVWYVVALVNTGHSSLALVGLQESALTLPFALPFQYEN